MWCHLPFLESSLFSYSVWRGPPHLSLGFPLTSAPVITLVFLCLSHTVLSHSSSNIPNIFRCQGFCRGLSLCLECLYFRLSEAHALTCFRALLKHHISEPLLPPVWKRTPSVLVLCLHPCSIFSLSAVPSSEVRRGYYFIVWKVQVCAMFLSCSLCPPYLGQTLAHGLQQVRCSLRTALLAAGALTSSSCHKHPME